MAPLSRPVVLLSPSILAASLLVLAAAAVVVVRGLDLRRFLAGTPVLTSISGVVAFQRAVARQMYWSLGESLLFLSAVVAAAIGLAPGRIGGLEPIVLSASSGVFGVAWVWCRLVERRARSIRVVDDDIARRRDEVVRAWKSRPLPPRGRRVAT